MSEVASDQVILLPFFGGEAEKKRVIEGHVRGQFSSSNPRQEPITACDLVCYTAVFIVVTQRSSPLIVSGEEPRGGALRDDNKKRLCSETTCDQAFCLFVCLFVCLFFRGNAKVGGWAEGPPDRRLV